MNKYIHSDTSLGPINVLADGLEVHCLVSIVCRPTRGPFFTHGIDFTFVNRTTDHEAGMEALIHGALAKGKSLADAYIRARESQPVDATPMPDKNFSKRTTIFACGQPAGSDGAQREFEVYVQDFCDPSLRRLTFAVGVGTDDEKHIVIPASDLQGFLQAMVDLQATPFTRSFDVEEAA